MPHDPIDDLRAEIARGRVLAIVGAGVSIQATSRNPLACWTGLLTDGVQRCVAYAHSLPPGWEKRVQEQIESGDLEEMLLAAENISRRLGAPQGGEYAAWLRDSVGSLKVTDRSLPEALRNLGIPLATTNYDGLLEEVTGLAAVTWREGAAVERVIRGDDRAILHLHGYWQDPESVVLGIRSYQEVLGDAHAQTVLRTLRTATILLFVGCGEGLADPNFGSLLCWTRKIFAGSEYRHYRLCRDSEQQDLQKQHSREERICVLPYGPDFSDLVDFLRSLQPAVTETGVREEEKPSATEKRPPRLPSLPRCFGRDEEVEDLAETLLQDSPPPVPILGGPGIGKSTITLAALHDPRVAKRFGVRRFFVRCDGAKSREALAGEIATTLRIEPGPNLEERLLLDLESAPAVLALDNAETPWEADTTAVEDLLSQLGGIPELALITSLRGEQRPFGPNWREAIRVDPLDLDSARRAFLAVAGERYRNDPDLDRLLEAVDRLPLAVTLLAHQTEGEPDLSGIGISDLDIAQTQYEKALLVYQSAGSLLGEANCIRGLGDTALKRSDLDAAQVRYEKALPICKYIGDFMGQGHCLRNLGDITRLRSDFDTAHARYKEALFILQRIGDINGQVNCIRGLLAITWRSFNLVAAQEFLSGAITFCKQAVELFETGRNHCRLARAALTPEERQKHTQAARKAWSRLNVTKITQRLIKELDREFNE